MKFAIITHVAHGKKQDSYYAYAPYVREMNIWLKYAHEIIIVAPLEPELNTDLELDYQHPIIKLIPIKSFNLNTIINIFKSILVIPFILIKIFKAMEYADHIHLRCPGNIGLLGCIVQIFFPSKPKTAKYAGNWDLQAKQPLSYKIQKWILSNTFLTKNMQVLVYGEWPNQTKNIKTFFTATYTEKDKKQIIDRNLQNTIALLFVGTLSKGKRPLYAVQLAEQLLKIGYDVQLKLYGEGNERKSIEDYINTYNLNHNVTLMGNRSKKEIQQAYEQSHFLILPSQSEGWPKVLAEAMFWGCLPVSTKVSCLVSMLGNGKRGLFLNIDLEMDTTMIKNLINDPNQYQEMRDKAVAWSRTYTLDYFEGEIEKLLRPCE